MPQQAVINLKDKLIISSIYQIIYNAALYKLTEIELRGSNENS